MKKYFKKKIELLIIISALFISVGCAQKSENLITNSGFEIGNGDSPEGWIKDIGVNRTTSNWFIINNKSPRTYQVGIDKNEFHSGKASYKISRTWSWAGQTTGIKTGSPISLDPKAKYLLSFWYKTKGITEYPIPLIVEFITKSENNDTIRTEKRVPNSDSWQQYFILLDNFPHDAKNLDITFYNWISTQGSIWLDDIEFRKANEEDIAMYEKWRRQPIPKIEAKAPQKKLRVTGFYRVEKVNDHWWLIDPKGNPTWAISIVGEAPTPNLADTATQTAWFKKEYGTTLKTVTQKMYNIYLDLGFNTFAGWTKGNFAEITRERYKSGQTYIPMVEVLGLTAAGGKAVKAMERNGIIPSNDKRWFVDPFNPQWRKMARKKAEEEIPKYKNKPWFLGWFVDNEIFYNDLFIYVWAEYSSKEFVKILKEKYKNIDSLNHKWSSPFGKYAYSSFGDILKDKPEPKDWDDPLYVDFISFERHMVETYINYTYNLVKELDPNHLIISNRFHWRAMPNLYRHIDLWKKYDIVSMNIYPNNNIIGFDSGELEVMKELHVGTGRPIIFGEFSVPALDSKLYKFGKDPYNRPLDWSWHQLLRTQKERGEAYEICAKQLASLNFMLGITWFKTLNPDNERRRSNRGLMDSSYKLYRELTNSMKKTNEEIKKVMQVKSNY